MKFLTPSGGEVNVLLGKVCSPVWQDATEKFPKEVFRVRIPVDDRQGITTWCTVDFINEDSRRRGADWAKAKYEKTLKPGEVIGVPDENGKPAKLIRNAVMVCGKQRIKEMPDGRIFTGYSGYRIYFFPEDSRSLQADTQYAPFMRQDAAYSETGYQSGIPSGVYGDEPDCACYEQALQEAADDGFYYPEDDPEAMYFA